jgi:hypothetical protein
MAVSGVLIFNRLVAHSRYIKRFVDIWAEKAD